MEVESDMIHVFVHKMRNIFAYIRNLLYLCSELDDKLTLFSHNYGENYPRRNYTLR